MEEKEEVTLYGFESRDVDRRRSDRDGCHDIVQLWQRSHEILGLALQGHKQVEIARMLDITPATVSNTLNSTLGKTKLSEMRLKRDGEFVEIDEDVKILTQKALKVYHEIFDDEGEGRKLKKETADTIFLDVAGHRAPTKIQSASVHAVATIEEIEGFKRRGIEAAKASGKLIDLHPEGEGEDDTETRAE